MPVDTYATHDSPVWRARADFVINAPLPEPGRFEQLWARQLSDEEFELCCIPFFLHDVALGDVVGTTPSAVHRYSVDRVVRPSGRVVLRVWFGDTLQWRDGVETELRAVAALLEWSSERLLAVDARDAEHAAAVADLLQAREDRGQPRYETGRTG